MTMTETLMSNLPRKRHAMKRHVMKLAAICVGAALTLAGSVASACETFEFSYPKAGASLSGKARAGGTHDCAGSLIWLVLSDGVHFYLQNPPARLSKNGEWHQDHIIVGRGITRIVAVLVTEAGDRYFQQLVNDENWGAIDLPPDHEILASLAINT